jgi:hypothetical protein
MGQFCEHCVYHKSIRRIDRGVHFRYSCLWLTHIIHMGGVRSTLLLFCSQPIISQHCPKQSLCPIATIFRRTVLRWVVGDSFSTWYEDPGIYQHFCSRFLSAHLHRGRSMSGCIHAGEYQQVFRLPPCELPYLSCPAPEVILWTCDPAFVPSIS